MRMTDTLKNRILKGLNNGSYNNREDLFNFLARNGYYAEKSPQNSTLYTAILKVKSNTPDYKLSYRYNK